MKPTSVGFRRLGWAALLLLLALNVSVLFRSWMIVNKVSTEGLRHTTALVVVPNCPKAPPSRYSEPRESQASLTTLP